MEVEHNFNKKINTMVLKKEQFFSIKYFDSTGLEKVSDLTGLDYLELEFEQDTGNCFIGQAENERYFLFCETNEPENEITFNEFESLVSN